jgi:hypothetical protein
MPARPDDALLPFRPFTPTEQRLLHLRGSGRSWDEVRRCMRIGARTFNHHVYRIADKLPAAWFDGDRPQERVGLYALRVYCETLARPADRAA